MLPFFLFLFCFPFWFPRDSISNVGLAIRGLYLLGWVGSIYCIVVVVDILFEDDRF